MNTHFFTCALVVTAIAFGIPTVVVAAGGKAERGTGAWVMANIHTVKDTRVPLYVSHVRVDSVRGDRTLVYFYTSAKGKWLTGSLYAWVPNESVATVVRDFGTERRRVADGLATRTMLAMIRVNENGDAMIEFDGPASAASSPAPKADAARMRMWTSTDGRTFEGELLSATSTHARIRRKTDGQVFDVHFEKLSPADQTFIRSIAAP